MAKKPEIIDLEPAPEMIEALRRRPQGRRLLERARVAGEMKKRRTSMPSAAPQRSSRLISIPANVKLYRRKKGKPL